MWFSSPTLTPDISGLALMTSAKGSINNINNKGDRGHPCLQPLRTGKPSDSRLMACYPMAAIRVNCGYWVWVEGLYYINEVRAQTKLLNTFSIFLKKWEYFGVIVDEVWQISEFYLKNWIFVNILNSVVMWTTGVNGRVAFLNIRFSLMKQNTELKTNHQHFHAVKMQFMYYLGLSV